MKKVTGKKVLVGVTGGIAAYKTVTLIRLLKSEGIAVKVVLTKAAAEFVTPLTFQAISGEPVAMDLLDPQAEAAMGHIELARWADLIVIAPASTNFIAKLAQGIGDDLLSTLCLATRSPIAIVPAMNNAMWENAQTQENLRILSKRQIHLWGPAAGDQACGETGLGRMIEPLDIFSQVQSFLNPFLRDLKIVITTGPTIEMIDPVRYITNRSSGKMGRALAMQAQLAGATVTLISGVSCLSTLSGVSQVQVQSAQDMYQAVMKHIKGADIFIGTAAVCDYRCETVAENKIKKGENQKLTLTLVENPDIIAEVAAKKDGPFVVGFAAETDNVIDYAKAKLEKKGLAMVAANDVSQTDIGFDATENALTVLWQDQKQWQQIKLDKADKHHIANQLLTLIKEQYCAKRTN